jgi:hypothetical protein
LWTGHHDELLGELGSFLRESAVPEVQAQR